MRYKTLSWLLILTVTLTACHHSSDSGREDSSECVSPGTLSLMSRFRTTGIPEPSGVVRGTGASLFVVGDQGDIGEMDTSGHSIRSHHLGKYDMEGITRDPSTGLLYAVVESDSRILEIDPETFSIGHEFSIDWHLNGGLVLDTLNVHLEGITFVPDSLYPEGGSFFVVNRSSHPANNDRPSAIYEILIPLSGDTSSAAMARVVRMIRMSVKGLSGICHVENPPGFYLVSDEENRIYKTDARGEITECYPLEGEKQEGIALDSANSLFIADDAGGTISEYSQLN